MSRGMLSLLAGLGQGYNEGSRQKRDEERRTKMDQIALDRAEREGVEFDQQQSDRAELRRAADPLPSAPDMVQTSDGMGQAQLPDPTSDNRDAGLPGTAPTIPAQRVGDQGMLAPGQVPGAQAAQQTPEAIRARQIAVMQRQNPASAMQMQAADLALKNTQMDMAVKEFDSGLNAAASKGFDSLMEWTNNSRISPSKAKWIPSADGKLGEVHNVMPDGTLKPTGMVYSNDAKGAAEAALMLSRQVPIAMKLKHFADERRADREEKRADATVKYQDRMATVAEKNADTNESYRRDMGAAATTRAAGSGSKSDQFDAKQWDAAAKIEPAFVSFSGEDGGKATESPELRLTYVRELNAGRAGGNLSPTEAAEAARTTTLKLKNAASDLVASARAADPKSTLTEAQAVRQILKAFEASSKKPAGPAATPPAAPPKPAPGAKDPGFNEQARAAAPGAAAGAPAGAPPAAAPAPGGFMQRMRDLGTDYTTPAGKAALATRVEEAAKGGQPLTETETLRAKQAGLI